MFLWRMLVIVMAVCLGVSVIYLWTRFHRFRSFQRLGKKHRILGWLAALCPLFLIGCFYLFNFFTLIVVVLHLVLFFALCDLAGWIINRICHRPRRKEVATSRRYMAGTMALILCALYLGIGWFNAHHVRETHYTFTTGKDLGGEPLRIVEIADSHLGITLDGESFGRQIERVQQTEPDIVLIVGDFVDDDTLKADMLEACEALGTLKTRYGVYFVFGNHDKGYYQYRDFTSAELRTALAENNVTILEDEVTLVEDRFYVIGRQDCTAQGRAEASSLTEPLDDSKYQILLDHQPNDYAGEAASGADLVLSGHTHGGHIFPAGQIGLLMHANDRIYGTEQRGSTCFVVTSGISGWAIPFKTGTFSEYVVIDIDN